MKIALVVLLCTASAAAQSNPAASTSSCGPGNVSFKVKFDDSHQVQAQPAPGKALVYFIHDSGNEGGPLAYPTTKIGVDGKWAGANHGDSYFAVLVDAGEHHVCATLQTSFYGSRAEFAHFTAEAGKVYYFRSRLITSRSVELLELEAADGDEGQYLSTMYPLSISTPKRQGGK
jgi:hypothetical protein